MSGRALAGARRSEHQGMDGHPMDGWWAAHAAAQHVPLLPVSGHWSEERPAA